MKKSLIIVISLVAVFFFASTTEVKAQWCATVTWDAASCSCANITSKILDWEIRLTSDNSLVYSGDVDVTNESIPYSLSGNDIIYTDTGYKLIVRVSYYDASIDPLCCSGTDYGITDGQGLIDCELDLYPSMN